jgi:hypothetical protein
MEQPEDGPKCGPKHVAGTKHGEENHIINTTEHKKKNQVVQKTCYITGRVEDTQEEQLGKFK